MTVVNTQRWEDYDEVWRTDYGGVEYLMLYNGDERLEIKKSIIEDLASKNDTVSESGGKDE